MKKTQTNSKPNPGFSVRPPRNHHEVLIVEGQPERGKSERPIKQEPPQNT